MNKQELIIFKRELKQELKQELNDGQDRRLSIALTRHSDDLLSKIYKNVDMEIHNVLAKHEERIKDDIHQIASDIFENMSFLDKFKRTIYQHADKSIKTLLSQEGIRDLLKYEIRQVVNDQYHAEAIRIVVDKVMANMKKELMRESEITKKLVYSTDATIRQTLMKCDVSYETETIIKEKVFSILNQIKKAEVKALESLNEKEMRLLR